MDSRPLSKTLVAGLFLVSALVPGARAEELPRVFDASMAHAVYSPDAQPIDGLVWNGGDSPEIGIEPQSDGRPLARVSGRFTGSNTGTLLFSSGDSILKAQFAGEEGAFNARIPLTGRETPVKVQFIDDYGNLKSQDLTIVYENFYQFQLTEQTKKKWNFDGGASLSYLAYSQVASLANVRISELGITPKLGVTYNLSSKIDLGASGFVTLLPISLSKSPDGTSTPRFYGFNLRIGYKIYGLPTGNIYLMTGPYFWGMLVPASENGVSYGVVKLSGPQLYLVGRFLTHSGRTAVGYLKAASILDGDGGMTNNRELAIGGAYQITPPRAKRRFMMNLDFASASFVVQTEKIRLNSYSLGISTNL
jgi:hypothetical protein